MLHDVQTLRRDRCHSEHATLQVESGTRADGVGCTVGSRWLAMGGSLRQVLRRAVADEVVGSWAPPIATHLMRAPHLRLGSSTQAGSGTRRSAPCCANTMLTSGSSAPAHEAQPGLLVPATGRLGPADQQAVAGQGFGIRIGLGDHLFDQRQGLVGLGPGMQGPEACLS